jgi:hypothetical protein
LDRDFESRQCIRCTFFKCQNTVYNLCTYICIIEHVFHLTNLYNTNTHS